MGDLPSELPSVDFEVISQLRDVMEDEFAELLLTYLDGVPHDLKRLHEALTDQHSELIVRYSHTLKGSSANLGILRLSQLCRELEMLGRNNQIDETAQAMLQRIEVEFAVVRPLLEKALVE